MILNKGRSIKETESLDCEEVISLPEMEEQEEGWARPETKVQQ